MGFSLNKVMLIGNLGKDAEHRFTTNNTAVSSFSLATTENYKDKSGDWQQNTTWHNIVSFGLSDFYKGQLLKGKKFYVEGRISKRTYDDKDGKRVYVTEVISEKLIPLENTGKGSVELDSRGQEDSPANKTEDDDLPF